MKNQKGFGNEIQNHKEKLDADSRIFEHIFLPACLIYVIKAWDLSLALKLMRGLISMNLPLAKYRHRGTPTTGGLKYNIILSGLIVTQFCKKNRKAGLLTFILGGNHHSNRGCI